MSASDRFWAKVQKTDGCWLFQPTVSGYRKYGSIRLSNGQQILAHRFAFEEMVGQIPDGMTIDHKCRNTRCVRPDHLEVVTLAENLRRKGASITHCLRGHEFSEANTRLSSKGSRHCRECERLYKQGPEYRRKFQKYLEIYNQTEHGKAMHRERQRRYLERKRRAAA